MAAAALLKLPLLWRQASVALTRLLAAWAGTPPQRLCPRCNLQQGHMACTALHSEVAPLHRGDGSLLRRQCTRGQAAQGCHAWTRHDWHAVRGQAAHGCWGGACAWGYPLHLCVRAFLHYMTTLLASCILPMSTFCRLHLQSPAAITVLLPACDQGRVQRAAKA